MKPSIEGFDIWQTGGNCQAYGKTYPDGSHIMVTDGGGGFLPTPGNCLIGLYDADGTEIDLCTCDNQRQMDELIAIMEHTAIK